MSTVTRGDDTPVDVVEVEAGFDQASRKGWDFFTKFLLGNVVVIIGALLVIGAITVWR